MTLNQRIIKLENQIKNLESKIIDLTEKTEDKRLIPETKISQPDISQYRPSDIVTGQGQIHGGFVIWNDSDLALPPWGQKPSDPTKGYNKHFHSRYAGGALDINTLELVEYDEDWETSSDYNPHSQQFWETPPDILKDDSNQRKIGNLSESFIWDEENKCWRIIAVYADEEE